MLSCQAAAQCSSDCQAQAQLTLDCPPPMATVSIVGNDALAAAYTMYLPDIGEAVNETLALTPASAQVVGEGGKLVALFGTTGATCLAAQAEALVNIQASVSVSVSASATINGHS
jgi:hypothetical protein